MSLLSKLMGWGKGAALHGSQSQFDLDDLVGEPIDTAGVPFWTGVGRFELGAEASVLTVQFSFAHLPPPKAVSFSCAPLPLLSEMAR